MGINKMLVEGYDSKRKTVIKNMSRIFETNEKKMLSENFQNHKKLVQLGFEPSAL
jgi:hypothetical protein